MQRQRKPRGEQTIYDFDPDMRKLKEKDDQYAAWELSLLANKMRSDSLWERLSDEQCLAADAWLFDDNLTYAKTAERMKQEFGVETTVASIGRLYRSLAQTRQRVELLDASTYAGHANRMPGDTSSMRAATVKLLAASAVRQATERPEEREELLPLAKVLIKSEENEIRLRRVRLEEDAFDFRSAMARGGEMEKVKAHLQEIENSRQLNAGEKLERVKAVKEFLFGTEEPKAEVVADVKKDEIAEARPIRDTSEDDYRASESKGGKSTGGESEQW